MVKSVYTMDKGLTTEEAKLKLVRFGPNTIPTTEKFSATRLFASQLTNILSLILFFASILAFFIGDKTDGFFILAIVILNSLFGFIQEYRAHRSLASLRQLLVPEARVIRSGKEVIVPTSELVSGDIIILTEGERIPADGNLIGGTHLEVDEAILTGESFPVLKQPTEDELFMGTTIVRGRGRMKISATGLATRFGKIAKTLAQVKEEKTPLEKQLAVLGRNLAVGIVGLAIAIFSLGVVQQRELFSILLTSVSVAVAAIPEGLPAVITIALALGMERMARKRGVVKKLASIEALGAVQVLLIDKTGTLTKNQMRVKRVWPRQGRGKINPFLLRACIFGNSASLVKKENGGSLDVIGDKTDGALLLWASEVLGDKFESFRQEGKIVDEYAFDPASKTITVIWEKNGKTFTLVRGAPEKVLEQTNIKGLARRRITKEFEKFAAAGLRVIGFGYKEGREKNLGLKFLGFAGIYDPPREEAKEAVKAAKLAGIRTVMVTGDNEVTAQAIAEEVGLIEKGEEVVTGQILEKLTEEALERILLKTRIFARVQPQDKLRITEAYQKKGFVVGVTGDGVNDALALKKANVGVAMGETGTDVAREAGDLVITDDNFATIIGAVEEGRTIYDNIVKSVVYLLSCNLAEIGVIFFAILLGMPLPLLPTQILWMNLVTDSLPALALAADTKEPLVLKRLPREASSYILNATVLRFLIISGGIMTLLTLVSFSSLIGIVGEGLARTVAFTLLVCLQMVQVFIVRGFKNPLSNKFLVIAVLTTLILQALILSLPTLRAIFHIVLF